MAMTRPQRRAQGDLVRAVFVAALGFRSAGVGGAEKLQGPRLDAVETPSSTAVFLNLGTCVGNAAGGADLRRIDESDLPGGGLLGRLEDLVDRSDLRHAQRSSAA
ncbi:MAG: hypothetical protein AAF676_17965 [Pseudomonadota bacterium]